VSHVCYVVNRREKEEANSGRLTVVSTKEKSTADALRSGFISVQLENNYFDLLIRKNLSSAIKPDRFSAGGYFLSILK